MNIQNTMKASQGDHTILRNIVDETPNEERNSEMEKLKAQRRALRKEKKKQKRAKKENMNSLKLKLHLSSTQGNITGIPGVLETHNVESNRESGFVSPPRDATMKGNTKNPIRQGGKEKINAKHRKILANVKPQKSVSPINSVAAVDLSVSAEPISFPVNEECTSLSVAPSGRHIIAGFTDGTLRLFDTTGRLWSTERPSNSECDNSDTKVGNVENALDQLFDCDSSDSENESASALPNKTKDKYVMSKSHQDFGAVACQIHAKGVITSLLMDVDCSEDGSFAFGGVLRGSTELVAVHLSPLEKYHDQFNSSTGKACILDLIKVYRLSDAKLKGFGACTRLKSTTRPEYRLFTGKGIKNMHIWSFIPPYGNVTEPTWQCLYDTPTNGNTISYLNFRSDANGLLQGISKSDDQKLRIWDLSYEQEDKTSNPSQKSVIKQLVAKAKSENYPGKARPKRPPYIDISDTENALGVFGAYVFSGGESMFNKMGVMFLDVEDIQSPFNHTELALSDESFYSANAGRRSGRNGRQQRGGLTSVVNVAGISSDATDVVLDLSDGSMVHYNNPKAGQSLVKPLPSALATEANGRKMHVSRVIKNKCTVLTAATYDSNSTRGRIAMNYLSDGGPVVLGFSELDAAAISSCVQKEQKSDLDAIREMDQHLKVRESKQEKKKSKKKKKVIINDESPVCGNKKESKISTNVVKIQKLKGQKHNAASDNQINKMKQKVSMQHDQNEHLGSTTLCNEAIHKTNKISTVEGSPVVTSPSSQATRNRVTVSPEQPEGKALKYKKNPPTESISKFFPPGKITKQGSKRKTENKENVKTQVKKTRKNSTNEKIKSTNNKANVEVKKVDQKSKRTVQMNNEKSEAVSISVEMDAVSTLCNMNSTPTSFENKSNNRGKAIIYKPLTTKLLLKSFTTPFTIMYQKSGTFQLAPSLTDNLCQRHFEERRKMICHHRFFHEKLRDAINSSVQDIKNGTKMKDAKSAFDETLSEYENILREMINRQQMEASSLAASQTVENGYVRAPVIQVSFPFPSIFDVARESFNAHTFMQSEHPKV